MFETGDKVYSIEFGWGKIENITIKKIDSFCRNSWLSEIEVAIVSFDSQENVKFCYTLDGKRASYSTVKRTLFFKEIEIPEEATIRPRWRANKFCEYYVVSNFGKIEKSYEKGNCIDDRLYEIGNYFETEETAMRSRFYGVFHNWNDNE